MPLVKRLQGVALAAAVAVASALLSGCAGAPDGEHAREDSALSAHDTERGGKSALSAELLYDLLLAEIAGQRGDHQAAVESLSRAAYLSRDRRIVAQAVRLAVRLEDHQRVIELSRLLAAIDPHNFRNQLALANAQLETGQDEPAFALLIDLARQQSAKGEKGAEGEQVLQAIASLLAKQPAAEILPRFRAEIAPWPDNAELTLTAALLALELQQNDAFRELIDRTLQLHPGWQSPAMLKLTHLADASPAQMPAFADGFLKRFPAAQRFRIHYGRLLHRADKNTESLSQLEAALRRDPQASDALFSSALVYLKQDNLPKALKRMRKFLALNPHSDTARLAIADIHILRREFAAAGAVLRSVASHEYHFDAQVTLATVIAHQSGVEAGIRHLRELAVHTEDEVVRVILEQDLLYRKFDLLERAKAVLDDGLERLPGHPDLLYNRGLLAAQMNLLELHERDMRELIEQQPDNAHAYNALGYTLADQTERLDEALELITTALEMLPNDPFILDSMGWVNFRIGDTAKAIDYLRRALAVKKDAEIAAHLGEALWVAGNKREAREIWKQGKAWSPDNATLLDTLKRFSGENSSGVRGLRRTLTAVAARPFPSSSSPPHP